MMPEALSIYDSRRISRTSAKRFDPILDLNKKHNRE